MESLEINSNTSTPKNEDLDVLIVGAGFSGISLLYKLRNEGFNVKVFEAGGGLGGTWYWNCYPGARCDTDSQIYKFQSPDELWKDFQWSERFPSHIEMKQYFKHLDRKFNFSKDIQFNTRVIATKFDNSQNKWTIETENGATARAMHLVLCIGFAAKSYTPTVPGLVNFKGKWYHSAHWPEQHVDLKSKRVAVIGTGASAIQIIQTVGPIVDHLTVYQRTPNFALPMHQYSLEDNPKWHMPGMTQEEVFKYIRTTYGGVNFNFPSKNALDETPEERRAFYEKAYGQGSLEYWMGTYADVYFNKAANDTAYEFWVEKTRPKITNPVKRDLLAPLEPPHPFGTKRPSLERGFYDVMNQENVDLIDINKSPIIRITEKGVETEHESVVEFDTIVFATGFDVGTGGMATIEIINGNGEKLADKWRNGAKTYLGMTSAGYPNLFFMYGPQAPTAFSNGPTCVDIQSDWLTKLFVHLRNGKIGTVEATKEAELTWVKEVHDAWNASLFKDAKSWYQGSNIPGKIVEPLNYTAGVPVYIQRLEESESGNYAGFVLS